MWLGWGDKFFILVIFFFLVDKGFKTNSKNIFHFITVGFISQLVSIIPWQITINIERSCTICPTTDQQRGQIKLTPLKKTFSTKLYGFREFWARDFTLLRVALSVDVTFTAMWRGVSCFESHKFGLAPRSSSSLAIWRVWDDVNSESANSCKILNNYVRDRKQKFRNFWKFLVPSQKHSPESQESIGRRGF